MKRLLICLFAAMTVTLPVTAQKVFKHLSVSAEIGTTGYGINLAMPVYKDYLVVKVGATFPNLVKTYSTDFNITLLSNHVNQYVDEANDYLYKIHGEKPSLIHLPTSTSLEATGRINISTFKAILEYYPIKTSGFHISAGFYWGNRRLVSADAVASDLWDVYETDVDIVKEMGEKYPDYSEIIGKIPDLSANIKGKTYKITSPGNVNLSIESVKIRPYLGIGFGRSVPDSRIDFQFDLGGLFLLDPGFVSGNEVPYQKKVDLTIKGSALSDMMNFLRDYAIYPVLNIGIVVKLF